MDEREKCGMNKNKCGNNNNDKKWHNDENDIEKS